MNVGLLHVGTRVRDLLAQLGKQLGHSIEKQLAILSIERGNGRTPTDSHQPGGQYDQDGNHLMLYREKRNELQSNSQRDESGQVDARVMRREVSKQV